MTPYIEKCKAAMDALLERDSYHLKEESYGYEWNYDVPGNPMPVGEPVEIFGREVWKSGEDSLVMRTVAAEEEDRHGAWGELLLADGQAFAISPDSVNEAGCIHTTQGLEFDYVGVIIGNDMRYENGKVVTDFTKRASTDQSIKGLKTMYKKDPEEALGRADEIIKDTYRTLMTRGMKGCYIYCTDKGMQEYLRQRLAAFHRSNVCK